MLKANAYAKLNWTLGIKGKRSDSYHELDMLMQSVSLCDVLTFENADELSLTVDGKYYPWDNKLLVCRADDAISQGRFHARITLDCRIPSMAGLGGGSADCAAALIGLNRLWNAGLSNAELLAIGEKLGADVSFCLTGGFLHAEGIGEKLTDAGKGYRGKLVLAMPKTGNSTPVMFSAYDSEEHTYTDINNAAVIRALENTDFSLLTKTFRNDLFPTAMSLNPDMADLYTKMQELKPDFLSMSGSGACLIGIYKDNASAVHTLSPFCAFCEEVSMMDKGVELYQ